MIFKVINNGNTNYFNLANSKVEKKKTTTEFLEVISRALEKIVSFVHTNKNLKKTHYFHVVNKDEHKFLKIKIEWKDFPRTPDIEEVDYMSYEDLKKSYRNAPRDVSRIAKVACCVLVNLHSREETASETKERGLVTGA